MKCKNSAVVHITHRMFSVYRTNVLQNGRTSFLMPYTGSVHVKEKFIIPTQQLLFNPTEVAEVTNTDNLGDTVFQRTPYDDKPAPSVEDTIFLPIMDREVYIDEENHWLAPLPFQTPQQFLPNNRDHALKRLINLRHMLQRKAEMREQFIKQDFMKQMFEKDQAEAAPSLTHGEES